MPEHKLKHTLNYIQIKNHSFVSNIFFHERDEATNVLFIKRKFAHHYKGSDCYMKVIDIYFFYATTGFPHRRSSLWGRKAGAVFANSCSQKLSRHKCVWKIKLGHVSTCLQLKNICFPPPKSVPDPPGCFRSSQPMCSTCLQLKNSCFPPPKSAPDPPGWPLGPSGSI